MPKFGIGIPTYHRENGESATFLARCLTGINTQVFKDFRVYLIGDRYEPDDEFRTLAGILSSEGYIENLSVAVERDSGLTGEALWHSGGVNANNIALQRMRGECEIYCHLDDDDLWLPNHLETLADAYERYPEAVFVNTSAFCPGLGTYPRCTIVEEYDNLELGCGQLCHSTASWLLDKIPFDYEATGVAADALMWHRINEWCDEKDYHTLYVPSVTVMKNMRLSQQLRTTKSSSSPE